MLVILRVVSKICLNAGSWIGVVKSTLTRGIGLQFLCQSISIEARKDHT